VGILLLLVVSLTFAARPQKALTIAVNDFSAEGIQPSEARIISERLRSELLKTDQFRVMERGEMENILKEQGFQISGSCSDQSCLVEVGQLLGVQQMVAGSIGKIGSLYTITARMIDIRSGEILFMINEDVRGGLDEVLRSATATVASRVAENYRQESAPAVAAAPASSSKSAAAPRAKAEKTPRTKKPLLGRPLFWVPVGAVVAGGAVTLVLLGGGENGEGGQGVTPAGGEITISWRE
jgi:TolB-like protein